MIRPDRRISRTILRKQRSLGKRLAKGKQEGNHAENKKQGGVSNLGAQS
jgi:hypothetical protein